MNVIPCNLSHLTYVVNFAKSPSIYTDSIRWQKGPSLIFPCAIFLHSVSVTFTQTRWLVTDSSELLRSLVKSILFTGEKKLKIRWLTRKLNRKSLDESRNLISNYTSSVLLQAAAAASPPGVAPRAWCLYSSHRVLRIPANKPAWSSSE